MWLLKGIFTKIAMFPDFKNYVFLTFKDAEFAFESLDTF